MQRTYQEAITMLLSTLVTDYNAHQAALQKLSPVTLIHYCAKLRNTFRSLGDAPCVADMTPQALRRICLDRARTTPKTVLQFKYALINFCDWMIAEGWMSDNPARKIEVPKVSPPRREPISDTIIEKMLLACDNMPTTEYRRVLVRAMLSVLAYGALRKSEVVNLKVEDFDSTERCIRIWDAKGRKHRPIYPTAECINCLRALVKIRPDNCQHNYLFALNRKYRMASNSLYRLLREVKTVAGFRGMKMTPHQFRHSCATRLANNGMPLPVLQSFLGHADLATTAGYIHTNAEKQKEFSHLGSLRPAPTEEEEQRRNAPAAGSEQQRRKPIQWI